MTAIEALIGADLARAIGEPVLDVRPIPEGHSGFTYWVDLEGRAAVLRLPPPGARIAGPADIPRQGRIMQALHRQGLPVPAVIAMSAEPAVDSRPFVLMERMPGERVEVAITRLADPLPLARAAIDVLKALQAVPLDQTGIAGEPALGLEGELSRWAWLMERAPAELTGGAPELAARLAASLPATKPAVMVHGDYHFGNMLFLDGRVTAVLDWEIAEHGYPLIDVCCLCVIFEEGLDPQAVCAAYGADPDDFRWTLALTYYKYAAILGYNLMLHRRGKRPDPSYEQRTGTIVRCIESGRRLLD